MRKTTKKKMVVALMGTLFIILSLGMIAAKSWRDMSPEEMVGYIKDKVSDRLDLDDAQVEKLDALIEEIVATHGTLHKDHESDRELALTELGSDEIDQALLLDLYQTRRDAFDERLPKILAKFADFHNALNDEQKAQIIEHMTESHDHWH
jgi:hypothetical protein